MEELYYLAGLIDGEGTITLSKNNKNDIFRTPVISCSSTTYELVDYLKQHYGGHISKQKVYQDHHKQAWSWKTSYLNAIHLCTKLKDLLREPSKAYRAKMIAEIYPSVTLRNGKYTSEQINSKLQFEDKFFHPSMPSQSEKAPISL